MLKLRCGKVSELYIVLCVYVGRKCLSLFMTTSVRKILLVILSVCGAQFNVSCIVVPRKLNSHRPLCPVLVYLLNSKLFSAVRHRVVKSVESCIGFALLRESLLAFSHSLINDSSLFMLLLKVYGHLDGFGFRRNGETQQV